MKFFLARLHIINQGECYDRFPYETLLGWQVNICSYSFGAKLVGSRD